MKKIHTCFLTFVTAVFLMCLLSGCAGGSGDNQPTPTPIPTLTPMPTSQPKNYSTSNSSGSYNSSSKSYGSSSTSKSSNKCLNCGKTIDDDALYCMSCLEKAVSGSSSSSKRSSSKSSSSKNSSLSYGSSSSKGYYGSDGYYNPTHDELEDAVKDAQDYLKRNGY